MYSPLLLTVRRDFLNLPTRREGTRFGNFSMRYFALKKNEGASNMFKWYSKVVYERLEVQGFLLWIILQIFYNLRTVVATILPWYHVLPVQFLIGWNSDEYRFLNPSWAPGDKHYFCLSLFLYPSILIWYRLSGIIVSHPCIHLQEILRLGDTRLRIS